MVFTEAASEAAVADEGGGRVRCGWGDKESTIIEESRYSAEPVSV